MNEDKILVKSYNIGKNVYLVLNEINYNNNHYIYLCNEDDDNDMMIRKVINGKL